MFTTITHLTVLVRDQDRARDFYTQILGFVVDHDAIFEEEGHTMRWLTLRPSKESTIEVALMKPAPEHEALIGKQGGGFPFYNLTTTDCKAAYAQLKANGVICLSEPQTFPWGIGFTFLDCEGNQIYLNEGM